MDSYIPQKCVDDERCKTDDSILRTLYRHVILHNFKKYSVILIGMLFFSWLLSLAFPLLWKWMTIVAYVTVCLIGINPERNERFKSSRPSLNINDVICGGVALVCGIYLESRHFENDFLVWPSTMTLGLLGCVVGEVYSQFSEIKEKLEYFEVDFKIFSRDELLHLLYGSYSSRTYDLLEDIEFRTWAMLLRDKDVISNLTQESLSIVVRKMPWWVAQGEAEHESGFYVIADVEGLNARVRAPRFLLEKMRLFWLDEAEARLKREQRDRWADRATYGETIITYLDERPVSRWNGVYENFVVDMNAEGPIVDLSKAVNIDSYGERKFIYFAQQQRGSLVIEQKMNSGNLLANLEEEYLKNVLQSCSADVFVAKVKNGSGYKICFVNTSDRELWHFKFLELSITGSMIVWGLFGTSLGYSRFISTTAWDEIPGSIPRHNLILTRDAPSFKEFYERGSQNFPLVPNPGIAGPNVSFAVHPSSYNPERNGLDGFPEFLIEKFVTAYEKLREEASAKRPERADDSIISQW